MKAIHALSSWDPGFDAWRSPYIYSLSATSFSSQPTPASPNIDTAMKFCGLLALGLPAAQAFRITLYAGDGCTGDSFLALDPVKACVLPAGLPASFDAQSIRVEETPPTCQVWMFTDASLRCDTFQKDTWRFWSNVSQGECFS